MAIFGPRSGLLRWRIHLWSWAIPCHPLPSHPAPLSAPPIPAHAGSPPDQAPTLGLLLTVEQAAGRLGTSARFVRRLIAERRIVFYKIGRPVRIAAADLESYIAAGRINTRS